MLPRSIYYTVLLLLVWAVPAYAERVVVLDVPDGGTSKIVERVKSEGIDTKDQKWFLRQVRKRGLKPKKILSRSKDLKRVMRGGKVDYIVAVAPTSESEYEGWIIDTSGEVVRRSSLPRTGDAISDADATDIAESLFVAMGRVEETSEVEGPEDEEELDEEFDEEEEDEFLAPVIPKREPTPLARNFLWVELRPQLIKHDVSFAGTGGALLTRNSSFYPGLQLDAEIYVGAFVTDADAAGAGVFLGVTTGFDSVTSVNSDGDEQSDSLLHLELEAGLLYRADTPLESRSTTNLRARFRVTAKYISFGVDSPGLPSTSMTTVNIVGKVAYPLFFDNFALEGTVTFVPIGFFGASSELFGSSSLIYGFGTKLGVIYGIGEFFGINAGYGFRLLRTQFSGAGRSDFEDTLSFDLVQGLQVGLAVQF